VFTQENGAPIHPTGLSRAFRARVREAGLEPIRFHDLRHTYATLGLQAGAHPKIVSERLGHSNIGITVDTYSHVIPALESDAATRVASVHGSSLETPRRLLDVR
jgi:integrase